MSKYHKILITGGAGFVGSSLAIAMRANFPAAKVVAFDNLRRRGSELTLSRLVRGGVEFFHGDIRNPEDIVDVGAFDLMIDCSAEPSVHAGYNSSPIYLINSNLVGTTHCLEAVRRNGADLVFLSTSRVYPIAGLRGLPLETVGKRLEIPRGRSGIGWSTSGISVEFPLTGARSLYGTTKLASELLISEYVEMYGVNAVINRCGVLAGPWQMGKVDQGFVTLWAARHLYGGGLGYMGFGGMGRQVRDILHVDDLAELLSIQLADIEGARGGVYNVGGGLEVSVSLAELTEYCELTVDRSLDIRSHFETRAADVPYYVTDNDFTRERFDWKPKRGVEMILDDVFRWLTEERQMLEPLLGQPGA